MAQDLIRFRCIPVQQPLGTFYIGAIAARDVLAIAYADIRRIKERDIEKIVGIQRELVLRRVRELKQYVQNIDATFPTSVILAVSGEHAEYVEERKEMRITRQEDIAKIIDGQHRIAGLEDFDETFELNVTIFIDMDIQDQAMTFATINLAQTKVSKSLVYDLYAFQKARSPQKTCHNIARLLNSESASPLKSRIKILGKATGEPFEFITQATFVTALLKYISSDAMRDRDLLKRGKRVPPALGADATKFVFRDLFIDKRDAEIAKIIWNYFDAVAQRWPTAWNSREQGDMLNRTQGFSALMRFLGPVYRGSADSRGRLSSKSVLGVLKKVKLRDSDFTKENYLPGTTGETKLFRHLREQSGLE
ncbi:MAG: DGQHR domain-containing protein [Planctomycetes bacterium]|nr:DGQHR domain-containing protein [Planctomycetota bacterium]